MGNMFFSSNIYNDIPTFTLLIKRFPSITTKVGSVLDRLVYLDAV
jgi:hypothetical protein